jgi:phage nucleotide-binding protein
MAVNLRNTNDVSISGVKLLVYGAAGAGKTYLIKTLPDPIILSAEAGLLSIRGSNLPYFAIESMADLNEVYSWLASSDEAKKYKSVALDSISEIAEVVLSAEKKTAKDARQAYGEMADQMADLVRAFRDLPGKHVYFSAKVEKAQDEMGRILYAPSMPGNKFAQQMPYFFDEVLALRMEKVSDGDIQRALMCESDGIWTAKDRSGQLSPWEEPDLGAIIRKIGGAE